MTTALVDETSVTNNSLSQDYPHLDDHTRQTFDTRSWIQTIYLVLFLCIKADLHGAILPCVCHRMQPS